MWWLGLCLLVLLLVDFHSGAESVIANILLLAAAAKLIYDGITRESLIIVNTGILGLSAWIVAWFFGHDVSFVWKGLMFISLGILCFGINRLILKKQQTK